MGGIFDHEQDDAQQDHELDNEAFAERMVFQAVEDGVDVEDKLPHTLTYLTRCRIKELDGELDNFLRKFADREQALWAYYGRPLALSVNVGRPIDPLDGACSA